MCRIGLVPTAQRSILSTGFAAFVRWILGFDTSSVLGVYVIRNRVLRQIALQSNTGLANIELVMGCLAKKCAVKYGELHVRPRLSGESKVTNLRTVARTFVEILKLRLSLAFR